MPEGRTDAAARTRIPAVSQNDLTRKEVALLQLFFVIAAGESGSEPLRGQRAVTEIAALLHGLGGVGSKHAGAYYLDRARIRAALRDCGRDPGGVTDAALTDLCLEIDGFYKSGPADPQRQGGLFLNYHPQLELTPAGLDQWYWVSAILAGCDHAAQVTQEAARLQQEAARVEREAKRLQQEAAGRAQEAMNAAENFNGCKYKYSLEYLSEMTGMESMEAPPITQAEIRAADEDMEKLQQPIVERFQKLLRDLKGRRAATREDDGWVAKAVRELADKRGVELVVGDQPVYFRWTGVYETAAPNRSRTPIGPSSSHFPDITVHRR